MTSNKEVKRGERGGAQRVQGKRHRGMGAVKHNELKEKGTGGVLSLIHI